MILRRHTANARHWGLVILAGGTFLLGGCKATGMLNLQGGALRPPETRGFHAHLADEYQVLAEFSGETRQGATVANVFYGKSEAAASGQNVNPESLSDYKIPAFAKADLQAARDRLMAALQNVNTAENARMLALAQVQFDCWLAYQPYQKNRQGYIGCRETFHQAMNNIDFTKTVSKAAPAVVPALVNAPGVTSSDPRTIHFLNDTMTLDQGAHAVIALLAQEALAQEGAGILLTGYSKTEAHIEDTSNNAVRRIIAVRNALYQNGVDPDNVQIEFIKGGDPQDVDIEVLPRIANNT